MRDLADFAWRIAALLLFAALTLALAGFALLGTMAVFGGGAALDSPAPPLRDSLIGLAMVLATWLLLQTAANRLWRFLAWFGDWAFGWTR